MLFQGFQATVMGLISLVLLALAVFAFVDGVLRREDAYRAADKQTKQFWLIILGLTVVVNLAVPWFFLLQLIGAVASIVYIVDVRPALKQVMGRGGGRRRGGSSSDGPYGPFNGR
ncbi:DUF2516 family protein [Streptomyces albus]|uniref:DUF2516 family protein n=1 Tax=Streptomyces albus TaxID=1888 RepID=A0A6C1CB21_9ACTN|nr:MULTISPECIES: DUF2516 family protein [Streptomyces]KPC93201.1 membrane protein [Streptomyces sp. NRRL F-6602]EPD91047.1 hypothetical protein HMPREF1486_05434 [Streptomyces sp. HPH0547]MDI6412871.1 DUF2516 family protein [Streptomyces albus]QID40178.1 DUF2516 family protein [Streptomyces albus]TGG88136.1 DUF2516 family protein [Streptomyces albus]